MPKRKYDWDDEKSTTLVKEYIKRPILWERKSYGHSVRGLKEEAWGGIAKILDESVHNCKSKMKCMFTRYRFMISNGASDRDTQSKNTWFAYKYFQQLSEKKLARGPQKSNKFNDEKDDGSNTSKDNKDEQPGDEQSSETLDDNSDIVQEDFNEQLIKIEMIDIVDNPITYSVASKANQWKRKLSCDAHKTAQFVSTNSKEALINEGNPDSSASKPNLRKIKSDTKEKSQKGSTPGISTTQMIDLDDIIEDPHEKDKQVRKFSKFVARKLKTYSHAQYRDVVGKIRDILHEADQISESLD